MSADNAEPTPATYANLAGETFTWKPGSAIDWSQWEDEDEYE